jgi:hypothetical protein
MTVFELIGMGSKKYGGFEKYIVEEARQLSAKGYKLIVIFDREPLAVDYIKDLHIIGADYEVLPQTSKAGFIKGFIKLLKKYRPEVVHTNFSSNLFYALPLAWLAGVKRRISTEHCLPGGSSLKQRIVNQIFPLISQKILPVSNMSAKVLKDSIWFGRKRIETLYLGVEDFKFEKNTVRKEIGISDDIIALMNIAYHNHVKGVDVLIEAMNIIVNREGIKDLVLYQIGGGQTGADTEMLHDMVVRYKLDNNVVWMGIRNDVPRLLSAADIYVQPSRSEGIPLSIMEASLASLPIVATKVGGNCEAAVEGHNALTVEPESPDKLAVAIMKLYRDEKMRKTYGINGRTIALSNFSLENQVKKLIEKYYCL